MREKSSSAYGRKVFQASNSCNQLQLPADILEWIAVTLKRHLYCILLLCNGSYRPVRRPFYACNDRDQAESLPSNPNHVDIDVDAGLQMENDRWGPEWVELDLDTQPMIRLAPPPEREYPDLKTAKDSVQQWAMEHRYAVRSGVRRGRAGEFTRCFCNATVPDGIWIDVDHPLSPVGERALEKRTAHSASL